MNVLSYKARTIGGEIQIDFNEVPNAVPTDTPNDINNLENMAHLINAAPELFEALEIAIKVGVARLCDSPEIDKIERAIAKARGES